MQTLVHSRALPLAFALAALFTGCVKRPLNEEATVAQLRGCGGGWLICMYPQLHERSLTEPSAGADTVVRMFLTQSFAGTRIGRVERHGAGWSYIQKYHREHDSAAPVDVDSVPVSPALVDRLLATIREHDDWQDASRKCIGIQLDGQSVTLEARIGAKYYTVKCSIPQSGSLPDDVMATLAVLHEISPLAPDRARKP